ncbi:AraC family transcriptional regulator [Rhizobium sp. LjRoot254]|uniref:AraC family transcriptional regulator n=1 Tax=Rhizobium sp. LjRoot254 TaxID=3342297 RepID=UPI003ECE7C06
MLMKTNDNRHSYTARIGRVVDYLHDHLEDELNLDLLADVAAMSRWHWHRVYTAMQGETVAATVRRLRLSRAADRLANSDADLGDIAKRAGYTTAEAFGRAFKQSYGMTPGAYREGGSHALFKAANRASDASGFPVEIVILPAERCVAVPHKGSYMQISRAFEQLFAAAGPAGLVTRQSRMIGVYYDDPYAVGEDELRSAACLPLDEGRAVPNDFEVIKTRGGAYAKLSYKGPYADMRDAYRWLMGVWLPASGHEAADGPMLEEYLNSPAEVAPPDLRTDIFLPIEV